MDPLTLAQILASEQAIKEEAARMDEEIRAYLAHPSVQPPEEPNG